MTETRINELTFSTGHTLTERLVADGAPALPDGYQYRVHITHKTLTYGVPPAKPLPSVTVRIGSLVGDEWVEVARYTGLTRVHLQGATVAAAIHAYEEWGL